MRPNRSAGVTVRGKPKMIGLPLLEQRAFTRKPSMLKIVDVFDPGRPMNENVLVTGAALVRIVTIEVFTTLALALPTTMTNSTLSDAIAATRTRVPLLRFMTDSSLRGMTHDSN